MSVKFSTFLSLSLLFLAPVANAEQMSDSALACSLPAADGSLDSHPDDGLPLGLIIQAEGTTSQGYNTTVEPTLLIDWGSEETVTNLSQVPAGQKKLVFGDTSKGFQVVDTETRGLGIGISGAMEFPNTTFLGSPIWVTVGLMPISGRNAMAIRYMRNEDAVENRSDIPRIDQALREFDRLTKGDVLSYNTSGGIIFWAGFGASLIGTQVAALARGDFQIYIEKVDRDHAYVKVSDSNIESLALQAGAIVSAISASKYSSYGKSFGFLLNLHDKLGVRAFRDLVRGNIAPIQKLAAGQNPAVKFFDETRQSRIGNAVQAEILSIPFLFRLSWSRERYFEAIRKRMYECDRALEAVYGAYYNNRFFQIFDYDETRTKTFVGTSYALKDASSKSVARGFFGTLGMTYSGTNTTVISLRRAMNRFATDTGLGSALMLNMPDRSDVMAHTALTLRAQFSAKNTRNIVRRASSQAFASIRELGAKMASDAVAASPETVCASPELAPKGTILEKLECLDTVASRTSAGMTRMMNAAKSLGSALRRGNEKLATKAFAAFGEAMMTNQFTFRTGLMMAGDGLKVDYLVSGSDFSTFTSTMKTVGDSGNVTKEKREPIFKRTAGKGGVVNDAIWVLE